MKFESITIKDIAKALKLSISTVSRALRDSYEISEETKKKVTDFAKENNYRPNPAALNLKDRKTKTIGVIFCEIDNPFFSQIYDGIESATHTKGYTVVLTQSKESYEQELIFMIELSSKSIDGLLISVSSETIDYKLIEEFKSKGLPIVFFDRILTEIDTHKVIIDNCKGAFDATEHLINNGIKKIGVLAGNSNLFITKERIQGYKMALEKYHLPFDESLVKYCKHSGKIISEISDAVDELIYTTPKPQAIFTISDKVTIESLRALRSRNIAIPEDIAFIGFNNSKVTDLFDPPLSVIKQPTFELGYTAANLLISLIESKRPVSRFEKVVLSPELIIRESTNKKKPINELPVQNF